MSLILKQEPANTISTPPAGKSTLFVTDLSVMAVKSPDGNVTTFPTVQGANTQVLFNDEGALNGNANLTFNKTTSTMTVANLSVTGTLNAGDISVSSIANGTSNVDITGVSGNVTTSVAGTPNVLVVTATGANVTGTLSVSGNVTAGNVTATTFTGALSGAATSATTAGTVTTAAQPNITSVGTLASLSVTATITGSVSGTAATITTAAQPNITSVGTLTSVSVSGNANVGNLGTGGLITATGNIGGGNIVTAGVVSATGNVSGNFFIGNGSQLTGIDATAIQNGTANVRAFNNANVTVSAAGNANILIVTGTGANVDGTFSASGNINAGNVTATTFTGALSGAATSATTAGTVTTAAQPNITSTGTLASLSVTGTATAGNLATAGTLSAGGNVTGANLNTGGNVNAPIIVSGGTGVYMSAGPSGYINFFTTGGDKATITDAGNIAASNLIANSTVFATTANISGNVNAGNVYANSGTIGASLLTGTVTTAAQPNITSTGTLSSLSVTGTATAGNLATAGTLSAGGNANVGNLGTTALVATGAGSFGANVNMTGQWINNVGYPVLTTDAASKAYVDTIVSTGIAYHQPVNVATTTTLAVATSGTVSYNNGTAGVGANLVTTGTFLNIDSANVQTVGTRILVKNEANAAWNGVYTYANTTTIVRATDADEYGPDSTTQLSINDYFFTLGGVVNEGTAFIVSAPAGTITFGTSNITFATFSTSQVYDAGTGINITGTTISANASQTQVTAVGTLTSLSVSGNANIGNIGTGGIITATGNITGGNISGTLLTGTLATAAQPNVTSVGTLTSLSVSGNANVGNIGATNIVGTLTTAAQPNITSTGTLASLAVTGTGTFGNAYANSGTIGASLLTGTLTTVAQPNVTSVGTLTSLSVSGNATIGNIVSSGTGGNISGANVISANLFTGTLTTAAQPNVTSLGTLTSLSVSGNATVGNIAATNHTGTTANLTGQYITTLATGTAPFVVTSTTQVANLSVATAGSATTAGTVTTAAQGNITSVGTLTGLTLANASIISVGSNTNVGTFTGNFSLSAGSRLNATYADLAEKYVADATYAPGTVLIFGGDHEVTLATEEDSSRVAGVVTTNPAYTMNNDCVGEHVATLALQGRVPVKVLGPVYKGDLLVSGTNGYATANNLARAGTIIGKSLENFSDATGTIEVAVGRF